MYLSKLWYLIQNHNHLERLEERNPYLPLASQCVIDDLRERGFFLPTTDFFLTLFFFVTFFDFGWFLVLFLEFLHWLFCGVERNFIKTYIFWDKIKSRWSYAFFSVNCFKTNPYWVFCGVRDYLGLLWARVATVMWDGKKWIFLGDDFAWYHK